MSSLSTRGHESHVTLIDVYQNSRAMPRSYTIPTKGVHLEFVRQIGCGQFGVANCVRSRRGELYCMKEIKVQTSCEVAREQVLREVEMMKETCDHPNVITYHESWFEHNRLCILMEYCSNGSLDKLITRFEADKKRFVDTKIVHYMQELSGALKFCHTDLRIMHRDIKPANVLIDDLGTMKLADFGLAKNLETDFCATFCGSPLYMSPEQCAGEPYSFSADVWALGCILYELMTLHSPWVTHRASRQTVPAILLKIREARPSYTSILERYPKRLVVLTKWMLCADTDRRATALQIHEHLEMRSPPAPSTPVSLPPVPVSTPVSTPESTTGASADKKSFHNSVAVAAAALVIQRSFRTSDHGGLKKVLGPMDRPPNLQRPRTHKTRYARDEENEARHVARLPERPPIRRPAMITQNNRKSRLEQLAAPRNPPTTRFPVSSVRAGIKPAFGGRKMSPDVSPASPLRPGWV